jgi:hypothetical protein
MPNSGNGSVVKLAALLGTPQWGRDVGRFTLTLQL